MNRRGSTILIIITAALITMALTVVGLMLFMNASDYTLIKKTTAEPVENPEDVALSKVEMIDSLISESYLKEYNRDEMMENVYRTMLDSLDDPYSRYLNAEELKQLQQDINSTFSGTGILFIKDEDSEGFKITDVIAGGPASVSGIEEGDIILEVNGETYSTSEEMIEALKGEPGTEVKLLVMRDEEELEYGIIRGDVTGVSVDSRMLNGENIGYIKVRSFGNDTFSLFESAISGFENDNVDGLIIDLRDNPGGLFDEGVKVADRILPECLVAYTVNKKGEKEVYNSDSIKTNLKVVVLINNNTASTGEMLAAAIQQYEAGTLIGAKTYGKGLIQKTHTYDDGSAINLTTDEFFVGSDQKIDRIGVSPDITVTNTASANEDSQLKRAIEEIKK